MAASISSRIQRTLLSRSTLFRHATVLQARTYAKTYKQPKEESQAYGAFRRDVSALRRQFREEWLQEQRTKLEAQGAQAAKEARMERLQEERALKDNRRELERMAKKRQGSLFDAHHLHSSRSQTFEGLGTRQ